MSEQLNIDGVALEREEVAGISYTYPIPRMPNEYIALSTELSSAHADDKIVKLDTNPELHPAQGAYFLAGQAQDWEFVANMGEIVDPRFKNMLESLLQDKQKVKTLQRIGEHLENGDSVVNAVPHSSLMDIGLMHALAYTGLGRLGCDFRAGIVISQGVTGLASEFNGSNVPLPTALSWASDKVWLVTPRTENTRRSKFSEVVPASQINQQNKVVRADIADEQERGGMLITAALSGTSHQEENGIHWLNAPTPGTLRMFARSRTYIAVAFGKIEGSDTPTFGLHEELKQISGDDEVLEADGHELMSIMTDGLNTTVNATDFAYAGIHKASS